MNTHLISVDPLTRQTRPMQIVDGLQVEVFTSEEEAVAAFAAVPSYVEQQAAAFAAAPSPLACTGEERGRTHGKR